MIQVAVLGFGFMGQTHFRCYARNPCARVVAVATSGTRALAAPVEGNIATNDAPLDLSGVRVTSDIKALLRDPNIDLIDICLPTREHARLAIAALDAGKDVLCEKPMGWTVAECELVLEAQRRSGRALLVGHCLRFWPQYVRAHELIESGELGEILSARFFRSSGAPTWSRWMMDGAQSGGAVLDLHVHDIDTSLWWFGSPSHVEAHGLMRDGLPLSVDAHWRYESGLQVQLFGGWNPNGGPFSMGFSLVGARRSLHFDSSKGDAMQLFGEGEERSIEVGNESGYQLEINYLIGCLMKNELPVRVPLETSRECVAIAREELRQMRFRAM